MMMTTNDDSAKTAPKKRNERTCAGCQKHALAEELVRVIHDPSSGDVAVDLANTEFGRGAHVHPSPDCVAKALKSGFSRVFKTKIVGDVSAIGAMVVEAADRRLEGLLTGARRAGQLAIGSDVVVEALREERAELVVVATDAAAAIRLSEIQQAIGSGKAIAWKDKQQLSSLMARDGEVAVIGVLHAGVASAIGQTFRMSGPFRSSGTASSSTQSDARSEEVWSSSSEVR